MAPSAQSLLTKVIPDYLPMHATIDEMPPQKPVVVINEYPTDLEKPIEDIGETEEDVKSNVEEMRQYTLAHSTDEAAKLMNLPSNKFFTPELLTVFAYKQARKNMIRAIEEADARQLDNFCDSFARLLEDKGEFFANYQSEKTGETMLHRALQMDYEKGEPGYIAELPVEEEDADQ